MSLAAEKEPLRKPAWIRAPIPSGKIYHQTRALMRELNLATVCEEAACPNIGTCWKSGHATIMILGEICTRACAFCNVQTGKPHAPDPLEPQRVAAALRRLRLRHLVITSVDRDDLADGGAAHWAKVIVAARAESPSTVIEALTPDFRNKGDAIELVLKTRPDVFNHNLETVPRLYARIRPGARYFHSLRLLQRAKEANPRLFTKSGIMVGLGEAKEEVLQLMDDLRSASVDFLTIGQYLRPTKNHAPVERYVSPDEFASYATIARAKGFLMVSSSPLTRSSYHAAEDFAALKKRRDAQD